MRAAVLHARHDLRVEDRPYPHSAPDELLLEVRTVGICGTDAHEFAAGPHMFPLEDQHPVTGHVGPMVPGHEFAGTVVEAGSRTAGFAAGDLVASGAAYSCGECDQCLRGRTNLCRRYATVGLHRDGALAQYVAVPAAACLARRPTVSRPTLPHLASLCRSPFMRCGVDGSRSRPSSCRWRRWDRRIPHFRREPRRPTMSPSPTSTQDRLTLARSTRRDGGGRRERPGRARDLKGRDDFTVVYEVSGTAAGLATARACAGPGVRIVLVGLQAGRSLGTCGRSAFRSKR